MAIDFDEPPISAMDVIYAIQGRLSPGRGILLDEQLKADDDLREIAQMMGLAMSKSTFGAKPTRARGVARHLEKPAVWWSMTIAILIATVFWGGRSLISSSVAADIKDTKQLIGQSPTNVEILLEAIRRLSSHSGILINSNVNNERQLLIAQCCTAMSELAHSNGSSPLNNLNPSTSSEMAYAERAIAAISSVNETTPEVRIALGKAYLARAIVWHRFGETADKISEDDTETGLAKRSKDDRKSFFEKCMLDAMASLRHSPNSQTDTMIHAYTLLGRSIHKSGSVSGLSKEDLKLLTRKGTESHGISEAFGGSDSNTGNTSFVQPHSFALAALFRGRDLIPAKPTNPDTCLTIARLHNAIGLVTISEGTDRATTTAIESYSAGIAVIEVNKESTDKIFGCGLMLGTLYGNLAEAFRLTGNLELEITALKNASQKFRSVQHLGSGDKLRTEFGLYSARLVIAEYRGLVRGISSRDDVSLPLAALQILSSDFKTTAGFELGPHEDWAALAIAKKLGFDKLEIQRGKSRQDEVFRTIGAALSGNVDAKNRAFLSWISDLRDLFPPELQQAIPQ